MKEDKEYCPICLGTKVYFVGKKYKDCTLCDKEGNVDKEIHKIYCNEYDE